MHSHHCHPVASQPTIRGTTGPTLLVRPCSLTRASRSSSCRSWKRVPFSTRSIKSLAIVGREQRGANSVAISCFACPSDPMSGSPRRLNPGALTRFGVPDPSWMVFTSYAGSMGSLAVDAFPSPRNGCVVASPLLAQSNGVFNDLSPIRLASVTDGLSNTIFVAEKSTTILQELDVVDPNLFAKHGWYITGNWGDTLIAALYPPNAYEKVTLGATGSWTSSASSLHPGGVNVLMGDGSVRFVKDSIQSWPLSPVSGKPAGVCRRRRLVGQSSDSRCLAIGVKRARGARSLIPARSESRQCSLPPIEFASFWRWWRSWQP